jgi:two-component system, sensor histidine kinase
MPKPLSTLWTAWLSWTTQHIEDDAQIHQQLDSIVKSASVSLAAALLLVAFAWARAPLAHVLGWLAAMVGVVVLWLTVRFIFNQPRATGRQSDFALPTFAAVHTVFVTILATLWGLCIWVFRVPQDFNAGIAVVTMQACVAMTGWLFFSGYFPALLMYSLGMFMPAALAYAVHGDYAHTALCAILNLIFVMQGKKVIEVIRIRHEKEGLVQQLQLENTAKQQALLLAQEATAAKTRFFAAISHDVRQPLYSLSLLAGAITPSTPDAQRKDLQQRMQQSVTMLDGLFTQLLEMSQLDAGVLHPKIEVIDLQIFMQDIAQAFESQLAQDTATLAVHTVNTYVLADRGWLQRMLFNLIGNALNYAPRSELIFAATARDDHMVLTVQDHGPGIAHSEQEKIFEEFYRQSNPDASVKGFGLGLPIVRRLARAMGTDVLLQSQPGQGCTFSINVPIAPKPAVLSDNVHNHHPPAPALDAGSLLRNAKIGLVEDDVSVGHALSALLSSWGAQVQWARTSHAALQWRTPMDVLIVDYQLTSSDPMNGVDVAAALCQAWALLAPQVTRVLVASSLNLSAVQAAGFEAMVKPLTPVKLRSWLLTAMATRQHHTSDLSPNPH